MDLEEEDLEEEEEKEELEQGNGGGTGGRKRRRNRRKRRRTLPLDWHDRKKQMELEEFEDQQANQNVVKTSFPCSFGETHENVSLQFCASPHNSTSFLCAEHEKREQEMMDQQGPPHKMDKKKKKKLDKEELSIINDLWEENEINRRTSSVQNQSGKYSGLSSTSQSSSMSSMSSSSSTSSSNLATNTFLQSAQQSTLQRRAFYDSVIPTGGKKSGFSKKSLTGLRGSLTGKKDAYHVPLLTSIMEGEEDEEEEEDKEGADENIDSDSLGKGGQKVGESQDSTQFPGGKGKLEEIRKSAFPAVGREKNLVESLGKEEEGEDSVKLNGEMKKEGKKEKNEEKSMKDSSAERRAEKRKKEEEQELAIERKRRRVLEKWDRAIEKKRRLIARQADHLRMMSDWIVEAQLRGG